MAKDLKEVKKEIVLEWLNAFPQLTLYSQNSFYKEVGPNVLGIELIKLPRTEEYRPYFVIYPLWKKDIKTCLSVPIILEEYYNKKGLQFSIPYNKHNTYFREVLESIKEQTPLSFDEDIPLKKLLSLIDKYSKTPPLSAAPESYLQAVLKEAKLEIALSVSTEEAQIVLSQINAVHWDTKHFKLCGIDLDMWLQGIMGKLNHRDELLEQILMNKQDKKISQLKSSGLIV